MSLLNHSSHHHFFRNKEINHFYIAIFLIFFGECLINIFVPIYLFNLGYEIYQILFFYFLVSFYFLFLAYPAAKIISRIGEKHSMLYSGLFLILYYVGLNFINLNKIFFFVLPFLLALRTVFFNFGYHLNYINHSDRKKRGRELAFVGILVLIVSILAPFAGGLLANLNFTIAFLVSSLFIFCGTIPLFLSKDKFEKIDFDWKKLWDIIFSKKNIGNFISFSGYAIESIIGVILWPIFLILLVGSINKTGLLISVSMLASFVAFYFIGKLTDKVNKIKLLKIGTWLYFVAWIGRIFSNSILRIIFIDSYKNLTGKIVDLPWSAQGYDLAKRHYYFSFIVSREMIFNFSRILVLPILIFIFWIDFYPFIISFLIASIASLGYMFIDRK